MIQKINKIVFLVLCLGLFGWMPAQAQEAALELTGRVLSTENASPLPGISVAVPGVSAAMTGDDGTFKLKVPSYDVELTVSGPLYQAKRIALKGRTEIEIRMQAEGFDASVYKEVLTPTGMVNNSHLTSSAVFLDKSRETEVGDMPENLLGTVAGLNVIERSGMEGSGSNMFLRGFNSLHAGNQPLLIVDGMVLENVQFGASLIEGYVSTSMGAINVKDIDRITVLRDASALYGAKGANGAILIQTKRVTDLSTRINVQAMGGLSLQPNKIPVLGVADAKRYLTEVAKNTGNYTSNQIQQLPFVNDEIPVAEKWGYSGNTDYYRYNQNTDWQDDVFQEAFKQQYSLDVSGGDEVAVYGLSLGYLMKDGVIEGNSYDRFNARINTGIKFTDKLRVNANMSFVYGSKELTNEGSASVKNPIYSALVKAPFTTSHVMNELGQSSPNFEDVDFFGAANPTVITQGVNSENTFYRFIGSIDLTAELAKNLTFTTNFGINFNKEREELFYPKGGIPYENIAMAEVTTNAQHRVERLFTMFDENRLTYTWDFAHDHKLNATLGFRYMSNRAENDFGQSYNAPSNYYTSIGSGDANLSVTSGALGKWNWMAFYANVGYNLYNKYFVDAVLSADASSRYGEEVSAFQLYPSITAAWLISSEKWFKADWVDMLKIRAGYTVAGNDNIGNYAASRYYVASPFLGNYGLVRGGLMNDNLKPERMTKFNVGLDMAFFNEALTLSADFYMNKVTDMLVYSDAPYWSGFTRYIDNGGEMENIGFDVTANGRLIDTKAVKWDLGVTVSHNKNEVTWLKTGAFNTEVAGGTVRTQVGSPLGVFYGYKTNGVYSTTEEAQENQLYTMIGTEKTPFQAGDVRFENHYSADGDNLIDEKDMQIIGDPTPDIYGAIHTNLKVKRFNLSAQFKYSLGNDVYNYTRSQLESMSGYQNQTEAVLNRWQVEGQVTNMPKLAYGDPMGNARFSDRWIEDGSFLKLKNVTLSYDIPLRSEVLTDLVVYGAVENLFTLTKYKGYDPEVISTSVNPLYYGVDAYTTPHTCTFYLGVKVGL